MDGNRQTNKQPFFPSCPLPIVSQPISRLRSISTCFGSLGRGFFWLSEGRCGFSGYQLPNRHLSQMAASQNHQLGAYLTHIINEVTPWNTNMEPSNHPFRKENDLNQTSRELCSGRQSSEVYLHPYEWSYFTLLITSTPLYLDLNINKLKRKII